MKAILRGALVIGALGLLPGSLLAADVNKTFDVSGWSCGSCANKTAAAVKAVEGVKEVSASKDTNSLTVTYDDAKVKPEAIMEAIQKSGYGCKLQDGPKKDS